AVAPGDVIAEIETDKATMEVESVEEGTIASLVVPEGTDGVKVNAVIALLAGEGEDVSEARQAMKAEAPAGKPKAEAPQSEQPAEPARTEAVAGQDEAPSSKTETVPVNDGRRVFASPLARRLAAESGIDLAAIHGSGP